MFSIGSLDKWVARSPSCDSINLKFLNFVVLKPSYYLLQVQHKGVSKLGRKRISPIAFYFSCANFYDIFFLLDIIFGN